MQPNPSADTSAPLLPKVRFCMALVSFNDRRRSTRLGHTASVPARRDNRAARTPVCFNTSSIRSRWTASLHAFPGHHRCSHVDTVLPWLLAVLVIAHLFHPLNHFTVQRLGGRDRP